MEKQYTQIERKSFISLLNSNQLLITNYTVWLLCTVQLHETWNQIRHYHPHFLFHILIFIKATSGKPDLLRYATEKNTVPFNVEIASYRKLTSVCQRRPIPAFATVPLCIACSTWGAWGHTLEISIVLSSSSYLH